MRRVHDCIELIIHRKAPSHYLGLDVSTKHVGFGLVNEKGGLVFSNVISSSKNEPLFHFASRLSEELGTLNQKYDSIECIGIEDFMKSFATGRFHTQGLFRLAQLNGILGYECYKRVNHRVNFYMPNAIRSYFLLAKTSKKDINDDELSILQQSKEIDDSIDIKDRILHFVSSRYPSLSTSWEVNRAGALKATNYDRADAILTAMYTYAQGIEDKLLLNQALFREVCEDVIDNRVYPHIIKDRRSNALAVDSNSEKKLFSSTVDKRYSTVEKLDALDALHKAFCEVKDDGLLSADVVDVSELSAGRDSSLEDGKMGKSKKVRVRKTKKEVLSVDEEVVEALKPAYMKIRTAITEQVRHTLLTSSELGGSMR
jgi:Holliday junction resolvasome RuvABC endonuclease subunit